MKASVTEPGQHPPKLRLVVMMMRRRREPAQQMKSAAGGAERQSWRLVEDDDWSGRSRAAIWPAFALKLFLFERVDEFDGREEADALAMMLDRLTPIAVARCVLAGSRAGDQDDVALVVES